MKIGKLHILNVLALSIMLAGCFANNAPLEKESFVMGTVLSQKIYGKSAKEASLEVESKLRSLENDMTVRKPGGEIYNLNLNAGVESVKLGFDSLHVLREAVRYSQISEGAFNPVLGPLIELWGFAEHPGVPGKREIDKLLDLADYRDIVIQEDWAKLRRKGQRVDLGGIVKGYAADVAVGIYRSYGIKSAFVNLGGNVAVIGDKPDGKPWIIGIQNPRDIHGRYIGTVPVKDASVVTSGDYQRYFEDDGKRYHHILDPRTGYPAQSGLISTTIVTESSIKADALSTAVFVMGLDKGMELVESIYGVEAIFITNDYRVFVSEGLKGVFKMNTGAERYKYHEKR